MSRMLMGSFLLYFSMMANAVSVNAPIVSPKLPHVWAKIQVTEFSGQQLFVSYNKGQNFERISWLDDPNYGQIINITWSGKGLLLIETHLLPVDMVIGGKYQHQACQPGSIGIFDPSAKIIYWVAGYYADNENDRTWGTPDASKGVWVNVDTLSYKLVLFTARQGSYYQEGYQKALKITPTDLAKCRKNFTPKVVRFGWQLINASKNKTNLDSFYGQIGKNYRVFLRDFLKKHQKNFNTYYKVDSISQDERSCSAILQPDAQGYRALEKQHILADSLILIYDPQKDIYQVDIASGSND